VIVADTSGLLAMFNAREPAHEAVRAALTAAADDLLIVSPYVVAELDYLLATRLGVAAETAVLDELAGGAYELAQIDADDIEESVRTIRRYSNQDIGITDASIAVLARRYGTRSILTLDRRHFDVMRPLDGGRFKLIPA
jgi:predicted nucleic acid-binding protein